MEFYNVIESRHTIRDFQECEIDNETIERIIAAGMKAPTNDHMRDWDFIVIKDKDVMKRLVNNFPKNISESEMNELIKSWNLNNACQQECYKNSIPKQYRMFAEASCMIIPLMKQKTDIMHPYDLSQLNGFASIWCAIENILLAATAEEYACSMRIQKRG